MIRQSLIPSYNFGQRQTRLSRQYMDEHFKIKVVGRKKKKEVLSFEPKGCYTIAKKFHINESSVFKHIRRHSIPTRQIGNYVYVPNQKLINYISRYEESITNTKVTVKLRRSNYKEEWYLIIESYPVYKRGSKRASRVVESLTELYPHPFGISHP